MQRNNKLNFIIFGLIAIIFVFGSAVNGNAFSTVTVNVLIQNGAAADAGCVSGTVACLSTSNISNLVPGVWFNWSLNPITNASTLSGYDVVVMPGGNGFGGSSGYYYDPNINPSDIRVWVASGKGYFGTCAGGYGGANLIYRYAPDSSTIWYYPWRLASHVDALAVAISSQNLTISMTSVGQSVLNYSGIQTTYYANGPAMKANSPGTIVFANYADSVTGYPNHMAIVGDAYGLGRIILCGPHPELSRFGVDLKPEIVARMAAWAAGVIGTVPPSVTPGAFSITVGNTTTLIAGGGDGVPYSNWTTSNWSIATVAPLSGVTTQLYTFGLGTVIVSVSDASSNTANSGTITVVPPALYLNPTTALLIPLGGTTTLTASGGIPPYSGWTTNNYSIATVAASSSSTATLFAINSGVVRVSVSDSVSQITTSGLITVSPPPGITSLGGMTVRMGNYIWLQAVNGIPPYSDWTTSNYSIATVIPLAGQNTRLYGVNTGTVTLQVKDAILQVANSDTITVLPPLLILSPSTTITKIIGSTIDFTVSGGMPPYSGLTTSNWSVGTVIWLSGTSARFYALTFGTVTVSVNDAAAQTVFSGTINVVPLPSISPASAILIPIGRSTTFRVNGGIPPYSGWTTSNWSIATVALSSSSIATLFTANTGSVTVSVHDSNMNTATSGLIMIIPPTLAPIFQDRDFCLLRKE